MASQPRMILTNICTFKNNIFKFVTELEKESYDDSFYMVVAQLKD